MPESVPFRAHARLLTMLGDQLIKDERIALVELVKNAYDADATQVTVDFRSFGRDFAPQSNSKLVITDNGTGMSPDVVRTFWMNPATPTKAIRKASSPLTGSGRILQGEKGIGRFAAFKLGRMLCLTTREPSSEVETQLIVDIGALDEGDASSKSRDANFFLDQVAALIDVGQPNVFVGGAGVHGTQIEISNLRAEWSSEIVRAAFRDIERMQPQLWIDATGDAAFAVNFLEDGVDLRLRESTREEFQGVLERAVLKVTDGFFDPEGESFEFELDGQRRRILLSDPEIRGNFIFKKRFKAGRDKWLTPECGPFGFSFYVFDLDRHAPGQYALDDVEAAEMRAHRVYLYRDGVRVYPYGDKSDDWLQVDSIRGTRSARSLFSNDQMVGVITISQSRNPRLRDKTSREGLLEDGRATGDFLALIQTILVYLRSKDYERYVASKRRARERMLQSDRIDRYVALLRQLDLPDGARSHLDSLELALASEREVAALRVGRTEQLAGVGMSVEAASHDLIAASLEALRMARHILSDLRLLDLLHEPVFAVAKELVVRLEFINERFNDVQGLFVSTRKKPRRLDVVQLMRRVRTMYGALHRHERIDFEIDDASVLHAVTSEAAVLQCLINLVDNATYWLSTQTGDGRLIRAFTPDGSTLVVTDSGPGVNPLDAPFIFEPFYSGKGDAGKGLGLYIAVQNGIRSGFSVALGATGDPRELGGATFVVRFDRSEER